MTSALNAGSDGSSVSRQVEPRSNDWNTEYGYDPATPQIDEPSQAIE